MTYRMLKKRSTSAAAVRSYSRAPGASGRFSSRAINERINGARVK